MKNLYLILIIGFFSFAACSDGSNDLPDNDNTETPNPFPNWLVPLNEVKDGGPGKDGIPAIESPQFVNPNEVTGLISDNELIVGIATSNGAKAYPHKILDWHEIVNDQINNEAISISYCPLTGTAFGWKGETKNAQSTFGVSGLLYNANLILYDRNTNSNWSQLKMQCINGELISEIPEQVQVLETNWGTWKRLYPNTKVLSFETTFNRTYDEYPYGDYKTNDDYFIFSASPSNPALPNKQRVFTLIQEGVAKVFKFETFLEGKAIKDSFNGKDYLIVGDQNLIRAFELNATQKELDFLYTFDRNDTFFTDSRGNDWSTFGKVISGPNQGDELGVPTSVVSFWFAIAAFYPDPEIYQHKPNF